jgi:hypothetical protein
MHRILLLTLLLLIAACGDSIAGPGREHPAYPGFDIGVYPGDAALDAWQRPGSPYHWVGVYLAAPCHRDESWLGRLPRLKAHGWGTAVLYVGQQDWSQIPDIMSPSPNRVDRVSELSAISGQRSAAVTCSASLLTASQGVLEGKDAADKTAAEGFPAGSVIFLDVEYVTSTSTALRTYIDAWVSSVLSDGRYQPGIYMARSNAVPISTTVRAAYAAAGRNHEPVFWVAGSSSSLGFSLDSRPTDVGLDYASIWQGRLGVDEQWRGVRLNIDVNVASSPSPSAPPIAID